MKFLSKTEAYLYTVYIFNKILRNYQHDQDVSLMLQQGVDYFIQCVENHEQDLSKVFQFTSGVLVQLTKKIDRKDALVLSFVFNAIQTSDFNQSLEDKWKNPLGRRFESQLQIELSMNPTDRMMAALKKVSNEIVELLDRNSLVREYFLYMLCEEAHVIAFGSFSEMPAYESVKEILLKNDKKDFISIMYMHFKFARDGIYMLDDEYHELKSRNHRTDAQMFGSQYYKDRGRNGRLKIEYTQRMGTLIDDSDFHNHQLPEHQSHWVSDSKGQSPDLTSLYTLALIENDVPYIAGPSGMTSRFMSQMLAFEVLTKEEKQCYVLSVTAYMVSAGFHSLHEVLGPIAFCLPEENLIPGYHAVASVETGGRQVPNFNVFYSLMEELDPEFRLVRSSGWNKLIRFIEDAYLLQFTHLSAYENLCGDVKGRVMKAIKQYQKRTRGFFTYTINPDRETGDIRAKNYLLMLEKAETKSQVLVIVYALLATINGSILKQYVGTHLNFNNVEDARNYFEELVRINIFTSMQRPDSLFTRLLQSLNTNVILKIVRLSHDSKSNVEVIVKGLYGSLSGIESESKRNFAIN